jgi:hypothetical protein
MSGDEAIYPTRHCFDDLVDFLNDLAVNGASGAELIRYTVVEGICLKPPDGDPSPHGWLECDGYAIEAGIYKGERIFYRVPIADFRVSHRVWDETRYSLHEVLALGRRGKLPPYRDDYRALCADVRPPRLGEVTAWPAAIRPLNIERWHRKVPRSRKV